MIVNQTVNEKVSTYEFEFDSTIFVKHYKEFLLNHMKQWDTKYAFSGEDVIIAFLMKYYHSRKENKQWDVLKSVITKCVMRLIEISEIKKR